MRTQVLRHVITHHKWFLFSAPSLPWSHMQSDISNNKSPKQHHSEGKIFRPSSPALQLHFCISVGLLWKPDMKRSQRLPLPRDWQRKAFKHAYLDHLSVSDQLQTPVYTKAVNLLEHSWLVYTAGFFPIWHFWFEHMCSVALMSTAQQPVSGLKHAVT